MFYSAYAEQNGELIDNCRCNGSFNTQCV